jgi:hypothetical protein
LKKHSPNSFGSETAFFGFFHRVVIRSTIASLVMQFVLLLLLLFLRQQIQAVQFLTDTLIARTSESSSPPVWKRLWNETTHSIGLFSNSMNVMAVIMQSATRCYHKLVAVEPESHHRDLFSCLCSAQNAVDSFNTRNIVCHCGLTDPVR